MNPSQQPLRVLLSAYACEPGSGSESGNGWNWARQLSRRQSVWVLTRANNRGPIERALVSDPLPNAHFVYFDLPRWARFWKKGPRGLRLYYYAWQALAYFKARELHRRVKFDLVHHISFATYVFPSFLSLLPIPFVWGPVGGGESVPRSLARSFGLRRQTEELLRNFRRRVGECDPFVRHTARNSAFVASTTGETRERLLRLGVREATVIPHAALSNEDLALLSLVPEKRDGPFRVISAGRLVQFKAFDLGLRAFARLLREHSGSEYWLIGDGPERRRLEKLARDLCIEHRTRFLGGLARSQVFDAFGQCDVLLFPSLHDSSGWVPIEAMAAGRPVICLDLGGPALQVSTDRGIKVPAMSTGQVVADLGQALIRLANDAELRLRLGRAARLHAQTHCRWGTKVQHFETIYHRIVAHPANEESRAPGGHFFEEEQNAPAATNASSDETVRSQPV